MGGVALRTHHGKYWRLHPGGDKAKVGCGADRPQQWEQLDIIPADGGRFGFKSRVHGDSYFVAVFDIISSKAVRSAKA